MSTTTPQLGSSSGTNQNGKSKLPGSPTGGKGSSGSSSQSPPFPTPPIGPHSNIPGYLSFIFQVEPLRQNDQLHPRRPTAGGVWAPPNLRNAYISGPGTVWRWQGGRVDRIPGSSPILRTPMRPHGSPATLFSQYPDTPLLLVVPFDARAQNVRDYGAGWRPIKFDHVSLGTDRQYYSSISAVGDQACIAAPGRPFWMPQLLYNWYEDLGTASSPPRTNAGLIGSLPILLALAVFSAPAANLAEAMNSIQPGTWRLHRHQWPSGHAIGERGVVISVFLDPSNPQNSTHDQLDLLQDGAFGPFYGCRPPPQSVTRPSITAATVSYSTSLARGSHNIPRGTYRSS